jgi:phosphate-selective porin OprO/OprP
MFRLVLTFCLVLFVALLHGQEAKKPTWNVKWDQGAQINRSDGKFKFKFGGRVQFDVMNIGQDASLSEEFEALNGAQFRRLRWYTSGTLYGNIKFKLQFDFAKGDAGVKDAYVEVTKIPVVGNFRAGHFKQPFGFEMASSSNYITMMERGLTNAFTPERDIGFMIHNRVLKQRLGWYLGYFFPAGSVGRYLGNQYRWTARVAGQPLYKTNERYNVIHLGVAYANQYHDNLEFSLSERPEAHLAPKYVNLRIDPVMRAHVIGGEFAWLFGPLAIQSEFMVAEVKPSINSTALHDNYEYFAYYVVVSWFITGEHKNYSQSKNCFAILHPKKNLGKGQGAGAWEVAVRYSHIDLDDKDLNGGMMSDFTFGVNWYLNPATKFAFNYIRSNVINLGNANIAQVRFQVKF